MQNQPTSMNQQVQQNKMVQSNQMPKQLSHGGHEVFDLHEVLSGMINVLDQYMMFRVYVKDQELLAILDRQYAFILEQYNITCECFTTGSKPSRSTGLYKMNQSNDFIYGLKPTQPKKPNQSINDIKDQGISGHMLGLIKSTASLLTMTSVEVTNPVVRRVLADNVPNFIEMAYEISLYQNKHQYYQVPQLSPQDMMQMTQSFVPFTGQPQMPNPGQNMQH
ncbi:spore coat protein CotF [Halalkalibacter nanhaiisediminis]|uniref:Spore coat protein CotF n=2 Tax=Halalkalibacter nanhaiisediminis TaxID=688079 RepID=A0A562QD59_9BACI|nr:spore coat protein CotF [Halalkalibacter nanhaiisediminis]